MSPSQTLPARLRSETSDLHAAVGDAAGLAHSVRTSGDYSALLTRLLRFHVSVESALRDGVWARRWWELGIDLQCHRRSALLVDDLIAIGTPLDSPDESAPFGLSTFPAALGCLYVVEGSALGGLVIAPVIRQQVGEVPTSFFDSPSRGHPSPWRNLVGALQRYGESEPNHDAVVDGARATFLAFQAQVAAPQKAPR